MQPDVKKQVPGRILFLAYCVGVVLSVVTQVVVMMQHGPKVYVSPLWALLYPVQLFITDVSTRSAYTVHISLRGATATAIGVGVSSALFGLILPALVGLARSDNRLARYVGFGALGIIVLLAVLWGTLPRVL